MSEVKVDIPYQKIHSRFTVLLRPLLALPIVMIMFLMIFPNPGISTKRLFDTGAQTMSYVSDMDAKQEVRSSSRGGRMRTPVLAEAEYHDWFSLVVSMKASFNQAFAEAGYDRSIGVLGHEMSLSDVAFGLLSYFLLVPFVAFSLWFFYVVNIAVAMTLLFRKKYPDWWFAWNQSLQSFVLRVYCYTLFLTDRAPALESKDSEISLALPDPKMERLNRFMPLVKWILVLPYLFVYLVTLMVAFLLVPVTFVSILLTGKLPVFIYRYQTAVIRFYLRIASYAVLLVTDKYPRMIFKD
ncbi:DUF4389 domain-containing protein [Candidatus Comchoanobacter bicostacola]|uniref:DUF4389 domain-containing protein n=1 Tax=Candidatus Comchoanobacter bicostacola TaxID=2919598 RepID=A0ABY5DL47_9GAMM|nr:DUF4389 domain-containing protein [Candidatus Comchoanobacter bicostacola]UTC24517.1 DUF4389 domain-containing protein [Candidatus Comchoanobacter bicostacola]